MKLFDVDFNEGWVRSFPTAEAFINSPSNGHLFRENKPIVPREEKLRKIWEFFNTNTSQDVNSSRNDRQIKKSGRKSTNPRYVGGDKPEHGSGEQEPDASWEDS